jgi:hypothetical protein
MGDNQVGMDLVSSIRPQMTQDGVLYYDSRYISDEEQVKQLQRGTTPVRFDWENKWLRGDQYAHMLNNIDGYKAAFGMQKLGEKQHPENIYVQPESKCCLIILIESQSQYAADF